MQNILYCKVRIPVISARKSTVAAVYISSFTEQVYKLSTYQ